MQRLFFCLILLSALSCEDLPDTRARFDVTIENLTGSEEAPSSVLSAGVFFVQNEGHPMFFNFSFDYGDGLELLAEDGIADTLFQNLNRRNSIVSSGTFPDVLPGERVSFSIEASYGQYFNFATMFVESNDLFYAFHDGGFSLFEPDGTPISGDLTSKVFLWDVGTEENQPPYEGNFQPFRQSVLNEGVSTPNEPVRVRDDAFDYPSKTRVIRITFSPITL